MSEEAPQSLVRLPRALDRAARARPRPPEGTAREAAVLMLFGRGTAPRTAGGTRERRRLDALGARDVDIVLLQRAFTLRHHPGQVAFPGGGKDPGDPSIEATALREAEEETGLDPAGVDVLGRLSPLYVPVSGFDVTPVVGWWRRESPIAPVDRGESAAVARVPIADLTAPENRGRYRHPRGVVSPAFDAGVFRIWGFTAFVLDDVLEHLGWTAEWDRRRSIVMPED